MKKIIVAMLTALPIALGGTSAAVAVAEEPEAGVTGDVIARVEDQAITFNQLNTMLNSSAVVGVSVPALGTPERDTARIVVLDKVISANLLYLDAKRQGLDQDPVYQRELRAFSDGMLAGQYLRQVMAGEISVSGRGSAGVFQGDDGAGYGNDRGSAHPDRGDAAQAQAARAHHSAAGDAARGSGDQPVLGQHEPGGGRGAGR